jgi:hypothetical protein
MEMETVKFTFTATAIGSTHEITIVVPIEDDPELAYSELADNAQEQAEQIARERLGVEDVEVLLRS